MHVCQLIICCISRKVDENFIPKYKFSILIDNRLLLHPNFPSIYTN